MQEQMSRQDQLDAVVRNYGEWLGKDGYLAYCWRDSVEYMDLGSLIPISRNAYFYGFTRLEVEQRKAELQNKPNAEDAPEWALSMVQWKSGAWEWHDVKKESLYTGKVSNWLGWTKRLSAGAGEVIGDWRNTLEEIKREPKIDKAAKDKQIIEEFKRMVKEDPEWKQLYKVASLLKEQASIWQEQHMVQDGNIKSELENWNGEGLPPVGCIAQTSGGQCVILAVDEKRKNAAIQWLSYGELGVVNLSVIKPIKSERDRWVGELMYEFVSYYGDIKGAEKYIGISEAIHDAIVSGKIPLPKLANK